MRIISRSSPNQVSHIQSLEGYPATLQRILMNRDVQNAEDLDYRLQRLLPPQTLAHIDDAVEIIAEAIMAQANIVIVGDYDVDGASSSALAILALRAFGLSNVTYLVPDRFKDGYGLSAELAGKAATLSADVIITVDNGISSIDGVYAAQQLGISVVITDHHLPGKELPQADAIVNPNLTHDTFASKSLAGVGVIFYVMLATRAYLRKINWFAQSGNKEPNMAQFLDLVALGTVADLVPLDKNNRILVHQGIQRIQQGLARPGIQALLTLGKRDYKHVNCSDLGFAVAPRINAAGRMDNIGVGIDCLLSEDLAQATVLAEQLEVVNAERKEVQQTMKQEALAIMQQTELTKESTPDIYILHNTQWHEGVVGLVASMIKEKTHRPALVMAPSVQNENEYKGSLRSVTGLHIRDALARVDTLHPNVILKFGGHAMAAGLSIKKENIPILHDALNAVVAKMSEDLEKEHSIVSDGAPHKNDYNLRFVETLYQTTPWGQGFEEPVFDEIFTIQTARILAGKHLKLEVIHADIPQPIEAIHFFFQEEDNPISLPEGRVHLAFQLSKNTYAGREKLQLIVRYLVNV